MQRPIPDGSEVASMRRTSNRIPISRSNIILLSDKHGIEIGRRLREAIEEAKYNLAGYSIKTEVIEEFEKRAVALATSRDGAYANYFIHKIERAVRSSKPEDGFGESESRLLDGLRGFGVLFSADNEKMLRKTYEVRANEIIAAVATAKDKMFDGLVKFWGEPLPFEFYQGLYKALDSPRGLIYIGPGVFDFPEFAAIMTENGILTTRHLGVSEEMKGMNMITFANNVSARVDYRVGRGDYMDFVTHLQEFKTCSEFVDILRRQKLVDIVRG
jgi:hypothetical protein